MRAFLTGATGFVGTHVLRELVQSGHYVRCLVRRRGLLEHEGIEWVRGDVTKPESLAGLMDGCDAVIHLVGIIEEHHAQGITFEALHTEATANVIHEACKAGIRRFVHMSANGAREDGVSRYQITKWQAEQLVRQAEFEHWTILRPSVIFGDPGPNSIEFCTQLARDFITPYPLLPIFGSGRYRMQPVAVEDVAAALVRAPERGKANGQTICAVGPEAYSYVTIVDRITQGLGRKPKSKIHVPVMLGRLFVFTLGRLGLVPITPDQFNMLLDGNTGDASTFRNIFGLTLTPFTPKNLAYLRERA